MGNNTLKTSLNTEELISDATVYIDKYRYIKNLKENDFSAIQELEEEFMKKFEKKHLTVFPDAFRIFHRTIIGYYPVSVAEDFISLLKSNEYSVAIDRIKSIINGPSGGRSFNTTEIDNVIISDDFILHILQQLIVYCSMMNQVLLNNHPGNRMDYILKFLRVTSPNELKKFIKDWINEYKKETRISDTNDLKKFSLDSDDYTLEMNFMKFIDAKIQNSVTK